MQMACKQEVLLSHLRLHHNLFVQPEEAPALPPLEQVSIIEQRQCPAQLGVCNVFHLLHCILDHLVFSILYFLISVVIQTCFVHS